MDHRCVYQPRAVAVAWPLRDILSRVESVDDLVDEEDRPYFPSSESITYKACHCGKVLL